MRSLAERQDFADFLQKAPAFRLCSRSALEEIVARMSNDQKFAAGHNLVAEGNIGREMFIILSGSAEKSRNGKVVSTLGRGDFYGELAPMDPVPHASTITTTSECHVLVIGTREMTWMTDIPSFRDALLQEMARQIRLGHQALMTLDPSGEGLRSLELSSSN